MYSWHARMCIRKYKSMSHHYEKIIFWKYLNPYCTKHQNYIYLPKIKDKKYYGDSFVVRLCNLNMQGHVSKSEAWHQISNSSLSTVLYSSSSLSNEYSSSSSPSSSLSSLSTVVLRISTKAVGNTGPEDQIGSKVLSSVLIHSWPSS